MSRSVDSVELDSAAAVHSALVPSVNNAWTVESKNNIHCNDQESAVRSGSVHTSKASATSTAGRVENSPQRSGDSLQWYHVGHAFRSIVSRKKITGREFNILNGWIFALSVLIHGALFAAMAVVSVQHTTLFSPVSDKKVAIACVCVAWLLVFVELLLTCGYLLTKLEHPLVKSRGKQYIGVNALGIIGTITMLLPVTLGLIGVIRISLKVVVVFTGLSTMFSLLFLGAQACRQRLIYQLFEVRMEESHNLYTYTYIWMVLWAVLIGAIVCILGFTLPVKHHIVIGITAVVGYQLVMWITLYYTYRSRNVSLAFSDWRSNGLVAVLFTSISTALFAFRASTIVTDAIPNPTTQDHFVLVAFVLFYGIYYTMAVCTVFLFGQIALIAYFQAETMADLNPQETFRNRRDEASSYALGTAQRGPTRIETLE